MLLVVMTHLGTLEIDSELLSTGSSERTKGLMVTIRGKSGSAYLHISCWSSRGRRELISSIVFNLYTAYGKSEVIVLIRNHFSMTGRVESICGVNQ